MSIRRGSRSGDWHRLATRVLTASLAMAAFFPSVSAGQTTGSPAPYVEGSGRVLRWISLVRQHKHEALDPALLEIARWPDSDVESVIATVKKLADFLNRSRQNRAGLRATTEVGARRFTADEVRDVFGISSEQLAAEGANPILHAGAGFHADIATLLPNEPGSGGSRESTILVEDGRQRGVSYPTIHWAMGRSLLDAVIPSPGADFETLMWYRDASAQMLHAGALSESLQHLDRARRLFPRDRELLLDTAYLHERFASPLIQAAVESVFRSKGKQAAVGSERVELGEAERWLREALSVDPGNPAARIRLGRIVAERGRPEEAAQELEGVLARDISTNDAYLAQLFLGRAEALLGRFDAARDSFARASRLFPLAQSPLLELSRLARESGDRGELVRSLEALARLPAGESAREDPWWQYYNVR